jgi:hypothetical protein
MPQEHMTMTPLREQPQYAEQLQALNKLSEALAKVQGRIVEVEALMRAPTGPADVGAARVAAALSFVETGVARPAGADMGSLSQEHVELRGQREALETAIRGKHEELHQLTQRLSYEVCKEVEGKHRKLAQRYLAKLHELDAMHEEEIALMKAIEAAGYHAGFRQYVRSPVFGFLRQRSESNLWHRVRELELYASD